MTTAKADNISGGRQWHAIFGRQTAKGMDKIWRQERAETQSSNDGCGSGSWQQWTLMAADDDDGNNRRWQRQTTKAADDNGTRDWAADYKWEGGEWVANNNGIRQKADKPAGQRAWKNKEVKFMQKAFFQRYGLSGWIFHSRKYSQSAFFALSVLNVSIDTLFSNK
jgi:hypothetical protein